MAATATTIPSPGNAPSSASKTDCACSAAQLTVPEGTGCAGRSSAPAAAAARAPDLGQEPCHISLAVRRCRARDLDRLARPIRVSIPARRVPAGRVPAGRVPAGGLPADGSSRPRLDGAGSRARRHRRSRRCGGRACDRGSRCRRVRLDRSGWAVPAQLVPQRFDPEIDGERREQRPLEGVRPAELVRQIRPGAAASYPGAASPPWRRPRKRASPATAAAAARASAPPRERQIARWSLPSGYPCQGRTAVTATAANSRVRYAMDKWNSRIGAAAEPPATRPRSRCASARNQTPSPSAHPPYAQPAYGVRARVAATMP